MPYKNIQVRVATEEDSCFGDCPSLHYNYGRRYPGINIDASGSYHRSEVQPRPADYVVNDVYTTEEPIPTRTISPD